MVNKGAVFDYEEIVCNTELDVIFLRTQVEKLLDKGQYTIENLRLAYTDKKTEKKLLLFIKKGYKFGIMQVWLLEGICEEEDYSKELEESGLIKAWLEVEIL